MWMLIAAHAAEFLFPVRTEQPAGAPLERGDRLVAAARERLGEPYRWDGRGTARLPGYDCLGVLFDAAARVDGRTWRTYEVNPSELVAGGKLGSAPAGLAGVSRDALDVSALRAGDVLYFLLAGVEIPDAPLLVRDGVSYWPWHTGMYVGGGWVLHAKPGADVREQPLDEIAFDALYVTR